MKRFGLLGALLAAAACTPGATRWEDFPAEELDGLVVRDFPLPNPRLDAPASVDLTPSESGGAESHFFVEAHVNGVPASLLIDTGGARTMLFPKLASRARLLLAPIRAEARLLEESVPFNLGEVRELRLGALSMKNLQVLVARRQLLRAPNGIDPRPMDGMLGLDFLRRFAVVLDYGRRTAALHRERLPLAPGARSARVEVRKSWGPMGLSGWTPEMQCRVDGGDARPCIFDSGASSPVVFVPRTIWKGEERIRLTLGDLELRGVPAAAWEGDVVQFGPAVLIAAGYSKVTLDFLSGRLAFEKT
jgi:predicted aspartyl protease